MTEPKKKPSMEDLLNQIYEWREQAIHEIRMADRLEKSKVMAQNLFEQSSS